jgi:methylmalonyl-CoA/ethylmalonyl-CoA epimerase
MNLLRVDHTAIVVANLDEALARYARIWQLAPSIRAEVPDQRVEIAFLPVGETQLELIRPLDSESGVARFLERNGESLHHVGIAVDDINAELENLAQEGVELIDRRPREGVHGLIAFVHPRGTGGVLIELVQNVHDAWLQA